MNIKQKFEKTKQKIAENKPVVIGLGLAVGAIATGAYAAMKAMEKANQPSPEPSDYDSVVMVASADARDLINGLSSFVLKHVDRDLYELSINPED